MHRMNDPIVDTVVSAPPEYMVAAVDLMVISCSRISPCSSMLSRQADMKDGKAVLLAWKFLSVLGMAKRQPSTHNSLLAFRKGNIT